MSVFKTVVGFSLVSSGVSAYAIDQLVIEKSVKLIDGATVHVFKDGRIAVEDKFGRLFRMKPGQTMQPTVGQSMSRKGNEVARLFHGERTRIKL